MYTAAEGYPAYKKLLRNPKGTHLGPDIRFSKIMASVTLGDISCKLFQMVRGSLATESVWYIVKSKNPHCCLSWDKGDYSNLCQFLDVNWDDALNISNATAYEMWERFKRIMVDGIN